MSGAKELGPSAFCWSELATHDIDGVKSFYGAVLGWEFERLEGGPAGYELAKVGARPVAGISLRGEETFVPQWVNHLSTLDVEASLARAEGAGGSAVGDVEDVAKLGRKVLVQDPSLAIVGFWQASTVAPPLPGERGTAAWMELRTRDTGVATEFYSELLGWTTRSEEGADYTMFFAGERPVGGMTAMPAEVPLFIPAHWLPYFEVDSCDDALRAALAAGGKPMSPTLDVPLGRIVVIGDVAGTVFSIVQRRRP